MLTNAMTRLSRRLDDLEVPVVGRRMQDRGGDSGSFNMPNPNGNERYYAGDAYDDDNGNLHNDSQLERSTDYEIYRHDRPSPTPRNHNALLKTIPAHTMPPKKVKKIRATGGTGTKTPGPGGQSALRALARTGMSIGRIADVPTDCTRRNVRILLPLPFTVSVVVVSE
ncbi:hypothetical protein B0H16DRAFT_1716379 [Mycena metata]|uniref:Uncharacterized protein n=1 Tax=Mycena metata TaxID=1033252 RepID=A0AAD7JNI3_9AGAR|nr:hypothetical protein B0H16DRAFT_1716379 [Mycena metata]